MRILVVTNLYPPHYHGGYEIRCAQVAEALRSSGHEVCVLTSTHGLPLSLWGGLRRRTEEVNGIPVHRRLSQCAYPPQPAHRPWTVFQALREMADVKEFTRLVENFRPDIVNWWSMYGLSKMLLPLPSARGIPDVHWIEHWWMIEDYGRGQVDPSAFWTMLWDGGWGPPAVVTTGSGGAMEVATAAELPLFPKEDALDRMMERWLATLQRLHDGSLDGHPVPAPGAAAIAPRRASELR